MIHPTQPCPSTRLLSSAAARIARFSRAARIWRAALLGLASLAAITASAITAQADEEPLQRVVQEPRLNFQHFGAATAVDGEIALVSATSQAGGTGGTGAVHALTWTDGVWVEASQLVVPAAGAGVSQFGGELALDGTTLVVSAEEASVSVEREGAAFVFTLIDGVWTEQARLLAEDPVALARMGNSVAVDGNTAIVGAWQRNDAPFESSGAAYIFTRSGTTWTQQAKLVSPNPKNFGFFGGSVGVSGDTVIVGEFVHNSSTGGGHIFTRTGTTWTFQETLIGDDTGIFEFLGRSVAIDGDTAVVSVDADSTTESSAGAVYVFTRTEGVWSQEQKLFAGDPQFNAQLGDPLALDGDMIVASAYRSGAEGSRSGAAYVFTRSAGVWTQTCKLVNPGGVANDQFGEAVAVGGGVAFVGARREGGNFQGAAYLFDVSPISITTDATPFAPSTSTAPFSLQLEAVGGTPPFTWSNVAGADPFASGVPASGLLSGPLGAAGSYSFVVSVTDALGRVAEQAYDFEVRALASLDSPTTLPVFVPGRGYETLLVAKGGTPPYTFSTPNGISVPALTLGADSGILSGAIPAGATPAAPTFDVAITDAAGAVSVIPVGLQDAQLVAFPPKKTKSAKADLALDGDDGNGNAQTRVALELVGGSFLTATIGFPKANEAPVDVTFESDGCVAVPISEFTKVGKKSVKLKQVPVLATGRYFLIVTAKDGFEGPVSTRFAVQAPKQASDILEVFGDTEATIRTSVLPNSKVKIVIKADRGEDVTPTILSVKDSTGLELLEPDALKERGKKAQATVLVENDADLTIVVLGLDGTAGTVKWKVTAKSPKGYDFALEGTPAGDAF